MGAQPPVQLTRRGLAPPLQLALLCPGGALGAQSAWQVDWGVVSPSVITGLPWARSQGAPGALQWAK